MVLCWQICYFFYKNIAFGLTLFLYGIYSSFAGQPLYNDWYLSLYNVFFTSLPVIALGVFDKDVTAKFCLKVIRTTSPKLFFHAKSSKLVLHHFVQKNYLR